MNKTKFMGKEKRKEKKTKKGKTRKRRSDMHLQSSQTATVKK